MEKYFLEDDAVIIDNNISTILEQIPDYLPNQTNYFASRAIDEYYLTVTIDNITVFDDKDGLGLGAGEIYLEVWANTLYSKLDNGGSYYSLNNDESAAINIDVFSGWTNLTSFLISVRESDIDIDDELGEISLTGVYDYNFTTSFYTTTADAMVWVTANITDHRTAIVDEYAIASIYQPYIYLDNGDYADTPTDLYYRVLEGFDSEIQEWTIPLATYPNLQWNVGDPKDSLGANLTLIQSELIYTAVIPEFFFETFYLLLVVPSFFIFKKKKKLIE